MNIPFVKRLCSLDRAFWIILVLYLSAPGLLFAASTTQIFVLHSYSHEYPWTHDQHNGFIQTLAADGQVHTIVSTEYLDTKRRAYDETYASEMARYLRFKYADYKPDSIYVTDDNALLYARDHLSRVFPGTPVFFSGVNNYDVLNTLNSSLFTGVFERKEVAPNLKWLQNMDKDANDLIFIGDGSNTYQAIEREARKDLISYRLRATFIAEKRLDRALARLHDLPGKYLFLTTLGGMTDPNGKVLLLRDIMKSLALTGRIVISMEDAYILEGVLGGYVTSGQRQGMSAAHLLLAYLHGKPLVDLPPTLKSPNSLIFDDRVLQEYGIKLPENLRAQAIFLNPRLGTYEQYRSLILGSLIGLAVLLFLVVTVSLLFMSRKNRELGLARNNAESANALFNQIAEQSRTVHWEVNAKGLYTNLSDVSEAVIGYRPEEIVGKKHFYDLHPAEGLEAFKTMVFETFVRKESFRNIENIMQTRDGRLIWVSSNGIPFLDSNGNLEGYRGSNTDITERKRSEDALKESEEHLRVIIEANKDAMVVINSKGSMTLFNAAAERMFGHRADDILGQPVNCLMPASLDAQHTKDVRDFFSTGKPDGIIGQTVEVQAMRANGEQFPIEISLAVGGENDRAFVVGMIRDITERKKAEDEKKHLETQLHQAQKMESIGTLAGGIAHDFNNILSSVIGYTELALDSVGKGTLLEDNLQEVYTAGKRARDLVKQILVFARQSDEEQKPIQVDTIVKEVLKLIRSTIPTTIEIKENIESHSLIMGNPSQVHQLFMNLFTNAAHAMEDGGGVLEVGLMDVEHNEQSSPQLGLKSGSYLKLSVLDTGTGIPPDIIESIFEPYFTTKVVGEGTGMGLAMVHGIADSYGGKIMVDSIMGEGTVFKVYLPITRKRQDHRKYESEELPLGTESVLFVDDEAPIAKMGSQVLERLGYKVTTRTSSVEALELFRLKPNYFDLIITDMTMPNMTGDRLAVELMKIRSDIPVILCTGYSKKISEESASLIGIKAFAYKPIVTADLAKTVRRVLDEAKGSAHA